MYVGNACLLTSFISGHRDIIQTDSSTGGSYPSGRSTASPVAASVVTTAFPGKISCKRVFVNYEHLCLPLPSPCISINLLRSKRGLFITFTFLMCTSWRGQIPGEIHIFKKSVDIFQMKAIGGKLIFSLTCKSNGSGFLQRKLNRHHLRN